MKMLSSPLLILARSRPLLLLLKTMILPLLLHKIQSPCTLPYPKGTYTYSLLLDIHDLLGMIRMSSTWSILDVGVLVKSLSLELPWSTRAKQVEIRANKLGPPKMISLNGDDKSLGNRPHNLKDHPSLPLLKLTTSQIDLTVSRQSFPLLPPISPPRARLLLKLLLPKHHTRMMGQLLPLWSEIHHPPSSKILFPHRPVRAVGDRVSTMSRWMVKLSGVLLERLVPQEGMDLVQVGHGGRESLIRLIAPNSRRGVFW